MMISLDLQNDKLTTIPNFASIFPKLQYLDLSGNALHFMESSSFAGLTYSTTLTIRKNNLTHIPIAISKASHLGCLRIDHKHIDTVKDSDLSSLQNLGFLNVNDNSLVSLSPFAFEYNHMLLDVDMHNTCLGQIQKTLLCLNNLAVYHLVYL